MATRVKHIETRIVTLFGIEDDDGNIVQQVVVQADHKAQQDPLLLRKFTAAAFQEAHRAIAKVRAQIEQQASITETPKG